MKIYKIDSDSVVDSVNDLNLKGVLSIGNTRAQFLKWVVYELI